MATAIDYTGAWQRLNEALAQNVAMSEGDPEMFAFLLTGSSTRAIELLHELHQIEV